MAIYDDKESHQDVGLEDVCLLDLEGNFEWTMELQMEFSLPYESSLEAW